ncbi:NHLP family bacteriocin export ABC transporter peptidase/permease/ATPase subunit [Streptomyces sp. NPDC016566]|uniref:NHLP family bacteriocin export ABC transporter peptidase/permease/ATPase subunit n=1 Tax=Streptomyces sp. NPDC016566 TaxID=3364967 RepID=UPI003700417E
MAPATKTPATKAPAAVQPVRTTPTLQMEAVECGAACLAMILAYHKRYVPLGELRLACGVSRDGAKASDLAKAARSYGLVATGFRAEPDALAGIQGPAIVFWQFNHFVVYEGNGRRFGRQVVYLDDPASGRRTVTPEEFDAAFTGVVLTFEPGPDFQPGGRKPRPLSGLFSRLRGTGSPLALAAVASLLLVLVALVMPAFTQAFIDGALLRGDTSVLPPLFAAMTAIVLIGAGLTALQQTRLSRVQIVTATLSHARFFRHLLRLPVSFFAQRSPAELTRRLGTNSSIAQIVARDLVTTAVNAVVVVVYAFLMWSYDPQLTVVGIGMALLNIGALRVSAGVRESLVARLRSDRAKFYAASFDALQQIETLKATGGENSHFSRWAGHHAALLDTQQRVGVPASVLATVAPLLAALNSALVLYIGSVRAVDGHVSIGMLVAFQALMAGFTRPVGELSGVAGRVQDFAADLARLRDVEQFKADEAFTRPEPERIHRLVGHLELDDVTFGYSPLGAPLLKGFSLAVGPGQQVALVGGSGSGKSTVSKLVSGLYTPWGGAIRLDGHSREEVPRSVLAASVAFVDQDIFLFEGSVRDNVALWDPTVPDEAVIAALRDAEAYEVVAARGGIHDARVEEAGRNFSGGQRQRLEIARALVRDPSVLVLDEATSALDPETERKIADNTRRRGCACLVIAHRLSTVRDSTEIIVMEKGQIAERGTHDQLIAADGAYAGLVRDH